MDEENKLLKKKKTKRKKVINNIIFTILFIIGAIVLAYPQISRIYYRIEANEIVADFEKRRNELEDNEIEKRMKLAAAYNSTLSNSIDDPYSEIEKKEGFAAYARMLEINERMGVIEIPTIDVKIPIYAGTTETVLQMGAGHLEGTSLPIGGNSTHSVITAHSGLPMAKLFTDLNKVKVGDRFYVHNIKETMAYVVDNIVIIEPTDFSELLIKPGHDYVTLLTCTPYMVNTHRLLVRGHRIEYVPEVEERIIAENRASFMYRYLFYISLLVIILLWIYLVYLRRKKRKIEKEIKDIKKIERDSLRENNINKERQD